MVCLNVDAEVLAFRSQAISDLLEGYSKDASLAATPKPQDAVQNLETIHALFAAAHGPYHCDERPQKRRKINANSDYDTQPAYFQEDRSVVLAKVSINLVGPHIVLRSMPD